MRLEGRVALVTGAAQGIGRAIADRLAAEGATVVINDLRADACERAAQEITSTGARALAAPGDVGDAATAPQVVASCVEHFGTLDIVVNNAGITRDAPIHRMTDEDWDAVHRIALWGSFALLRAAAPVLRGDGSQTHHRKVVNMSSSVGVHGAPGTANYAAAKAGMIGLTKTAAREWARHRVNVNAVAPGLIDGTGLTAGKPAGLIAQVAAHVPLGRAGTPEDVAAAVAFLASPDSDYVTGQVVEIHGGLEVLA
ncbi:MAG: SDR family NAD(P)-dependent oxidoreductase [Solirubrobacteraceae bacterium]|nr:SDR family NAD(P)-dependent oxidoreductase [Patulibacter sp.]